MADQGFLERGGGGGGGEKYQLIPKYSCASMNKKTSVKGEECTRLYYVLCGNSRVSDVIVVIKL